MSIPGRCDKRTIVKRVLRGEGEHEMSLVVYRNERTGVCNIAIAGRAGPKPDWWFRSVKPAIDEADERGAFLPEGSEADALANLAALVEIVDEALLLELERSA